MAANASLDETTPMTAATLTPNEQPAWPTFINSACQQRSGYVTSVITPHVATGLCYINPVRAIGPFSGLGGTDKRPVLIPTFFVVKVGAKVSVYAIPDDDVTPLVLPSPDFLIVMFCEC